MIVAPPLPRHCGSWVVVHRPTGKAMFETFDAATFEHLNPDIYEARTALDWLVSLNRPPQP